MNSKRISVVLLAVCLFFLSRPFHVLADRCDDVMAEASRIFDAASAASEHKNYAEAVKLYEEAEGHYRTASVLKNCRCAQTEEIALKNIETCRKNAAVNKDALENKAVYAAEVKVVETYKRAAEIFNQGKSYAGSRRWRKAAKAFDEAAEIWESICSPETENGRRALESAGKSRRLAETARQRLKNS